MTQHAAPGRPGGAADRRESPALAGVAAPTADRSIARVAPVGRRRRPSGEAPPLPRPVRHSTRVFLAVIAATAALEAALFARPILRVVTIGDDAVLRALVALRNEPTTQVLLAVTGLGSVWVARALAWATIAVLLAVRRFRHLLTYLVIWLAVSFVAAWLSVALGRMRPTGIVILGDWEGWAHPSRPVTNLALALVGILYTLVPHGRWRNLAKWVAVAVLGLVCAARLYLGVDHPSDIAVAVVLGWLLPIVVYRLVTPEEVFPVTYRRGTTAHLDVTGPRGQAIVQALDHQLGLDIVAVEPFGLAGSAGSTPLRLRTSSRGGTSRLLFGKLYAVTHLRSDRWYKLARTVLYGRLEDEKPFSTVRRLVMYEDHMLRLLRDTGLPTPAPYGLVEITPEREYLIVMEFCDGAREIGGAPLDDHELDDALRIVRRLWDAGVAHRDIKPSNLLVRDGSVLLIDVAFASVRATPWRQAVDLANMMLTLALCSEPERVYRHALRLFTAEDIAEAFAASRSITIPSQLRTRLRADRRDLVAEFRRLAPPRPPVPIQLWGLRRVAATAAVLGILALAIVVATAYVQVAGLV